MYEKSLPNRTGLSPEFQDGVTTFIEWVKSQHAYLDGEKIKCPCRKGRNKVFKTTDDVNFKLFMKDFLSEYYNWTSHDEERVQKYFDAIMVTPVQEEQTPIFYVMEGTSTPWVMRGRWIGRRGWVFMLPSRLSGLLIITRMVCLMMDNINLNYCKFCGEAKYEPIRERNSNCKKTLYAILMYLPIIPHLQRLYTSEAIVEQMTWYVNHQKEEGFMCHPSDAEAWRHFNWIYPDFAAKPHYVRLGLCTDGFASHGWYGRAYSCQPIILIPYNLPPGMCINFKYTFPTMVIPDPSNPKRVIDVYLEPLIEELQNLWHVGVLMHDNLKNKIFPMRATFMWTVNDHTRL
ncbi:UNVERIFIED_CONTAM: hypothetical protein Sindi_0054200 [Sesamum indicum]